MMHVRRSQEKKRGIGMWLVRGGRTGVHEMICIVGKPSFQPGSQSVSRGDRYLKYSNSQVDKG